MLEISLAPAQVWTGCYTIVHHYAVTATSCGFSYLYVMYQHIVVIAHSAVHVLHRGQTTYLHEYVDPHCGVGSPVQRGLYCTVCGHCQLRLRM